jgi:hypothetical protein
MVLTDSPYALHCLKNVHEWSQRGWVIKGQPLPNKDLLERLLWILGMIVGRVIPAHAERTASRAHVRVGLEETADSRNTRRWVLEARRFRDEVLRGTRGVRRRLVQP